MINDTLPEFVFIRACILFLDNIVPFGLLYCTLAIVSILVPPLARLRCLPAPVFAWLAWEVAFHLLVFQPRFKTLERDALHPELLPRSERQKLFDRCNNTIFDPESYWSNWFGGADKNEIRRENVKEFLRWAFLNSGDIQKQYEEEIELYTKQSERRLGRRFPEGRGNAKSLRVTLDPIGFRRRSFLWYMCIAVVDTIASSRLWWQGFQLHCLPKRDFFHLFPFRPISLLSPYKAPVSNLTYWHRPHYSKTKLPVLFIHGIGIGLYPYTTFLRDMKRELADSEDGEVGIIALEIMPVSFRITHEAVSSGAMVDEIRTILRKHSWNQVVLVAHSYGSIIATYLNKSPLTKEMIGSIVLIDPITFLLHHPDVVYNFVSRKPVRANEHQLKFFAGMDTGVAHTLARRFFWAENIMWLEDFRLDSGVRSVTVVLAGRDLIVNTRTVAKYLLTTNSRSNDGKTTYDANEPAMGYSKTFIADSKNRGEWKSGPWKQFELNLLWFEELDHAQVFDALTARSILTRVVRRYCIG